MMYSGEKRAALTWIQQQWTFDRLSNLVIRQGPGGHHSEEVQHHASIYVCRLYWPFEQAEHVTTELPLWGRAA